MITFIKILIFGKIFLLTNSPINLGNEPVNIALNPAISSITGAGLLKIEISDLRSEAKQYSTIELKQIYPKGSIQAVFHNSKNDIFVEFLDGNYSVEEGRSFLILAPNRTMDVDVEFDRLIISSSREIDGVKLSWQNYLM